jgi:tRNA (guanine37-N1)-methyltransferase
MVKFDIITIFPELFNGFLAESLLARAQVKKLITIKTHDLRKWTTDKHKTVDDRPYGGGAGMILKIEPIYKAVQFLKLSESKKQNKAKRIQGKDWNKKSRVILLSAKGKTFTQRDAKRLSKYSHLIFICGRYEGVDERVAKYIADEEISIGNYVLFGGEVAAMVLIEAISRLVPGVVAKQESIKNESFSNWKLENGKWKFNLEYPQYTRPEVFIMGNKKLKVPKVLLSGDHKKIEKWREKNQKNNPLDNKYS